MSGNLTVNARIKLRSRRSGPLTDPAELYSSEIVFNDIDKSIVIKGYDDSTLHTYLPVDDNSETTSSETTWSSEKIESVLESAFGGFITYMENYVDEQIELNKMNTVMLPSSSLTPKSDSTGCEYSETSNILGTGSPQPLYNVGKTVFYQNKVGYWNLVVPENYPGSIKSITLCVSNSSGSSLSNINFRLTSNVFQTSPFNMSTGHTPITNYYDFSGISITNNVFTTIHSDVSDIYLFGAAENKNKFCVMELSLNAVTASDKPVNFHYIKIQF